MALTVDIVKRFKGFTLQVSFTQDGGTLALLGASGCGKSMTLRCIAGIEKPDRGRILLDGETLFDSERHINLSPQARRVGLMFQRYALFPQMTVWQNVRCGAMRGRTGEARERAVGETLERLGLSALADRLPAQLSGGQQQRVALARILVSKPRLLMLDEPFSALDSHLRFRTEEETRREIRAFGGTVLLVSHDRDEIFRMADRVAILDAGRVRAIGPRDEVFADPGSRAGCLLTGCKNLSAIRRIDGNHAEALDWGIPLELALREGTDALGLRMHSVRPGVGENTFRCRVADVVENPFSFTVMLRPVAAPENSVPIGWELPKDEWRAMAAREITVHFPAGELLQLKG